MCKSGDFQRVFAHGSVCGLPARCREVFGRLSVCRTSALGYHRYGCERTECGHKEVVYHSCGDRHCPNCGGMKREQWIEAREAELLPTKYYHVVFTLPHEWNSLVLGNRRELLRVLFDAGSGTLLNFGRNRAYVGGELGITAVLHTWGQDLSFHPHIHCIVSGGGYDEAAGVWRESKHSSGRFLFPVSGMSKMYKAIFLKKVRQLHGKGLLNVGGQDVEGIIASTGSKDWNVYAKAPFDGVEGVIKYLGRYTHKSAITRHRILEVSDERVRFKYRDYADADKPKEMSLSIEEFLRRLSLHILPKGMVRLRHYGYLRNRGKQARLACIREVFGLPASVVVSVSVRVRLMERYGVDVALCPCCKQGKLILEGVYYGREVAASNKASPATA